MSEKQKSIAVTIIDVISNLRHNQTQIHLHAITEQINKTPHYASPAGYPICPFLFVKELFPLRHLALLFSFTRP